MRSSYLPIILRRPTVAATGPRITFTDSFTGTNGDPPNARWTPREAGWTIQSNALNYAGATYGLCVANCTAGDNDFSVDWTVTTANSYAGQAIRYVDGNNLVWVFRDGANSDKLTLTAVVAGVNVGAIVETGTTGFFSGVTIRIWSVGDLISVSANGTGVVSGTFTQFASATKIAIGLNTGFSAAVIDNAVLA